MKLFYPWFTNFRNRTAHIRHHCRKTTLLSCHRCLIDWCWKNEQHLNIDNNFYHQMSLSKSKCWCSKYCLHLLQRTVPLARVLVAGKLFQFSLMFAGKLEPNLKYSKSKWKFLHSNKHLALPTHIRWGWKSLPRTNARTYYKIRNLRPFKALYHWTLGPML